jgi:hypothetical protein
MRIGALNQSAIRNWNYNSRYVQKKFLPAAFTLMNVVVLARVSRIFCILRQPQLYNLNLNRIKQLNGSHFDTTTLWTELATQTCKSVAQLFPKQRK